MSSISSDQLSLVMIRLRGEIFTHLLPLLVVVFGFGRTHNFIPSMLLNSA